MVRFTPRAFNPGERAPGTHWIGGWVGPRAGLDDVEKTKFFTLPGLRPLCRPSRNESLYRLRYPGSLFSQTRRRKNLYSQLMDRNRSRKLNIYYFAVLVNLGHVSCSILRKKRGVDIISQNFLFVVCICFPRGTTLKAQIKHCTASIPVTMAPTLKAKSSLCLTTRKSQ
jgi:hypothetical protein